MIPALERVANERLRDRHARRCGLPSGIWRRCLLDDHALAAVVQTMALQPDAAVLDVSPDPRFLWRWLQWSAAAVQVVSVLQMPPPRPGGYDRVFALEPSSDGSLGDALARCIAGNMASGGRCAITLASFDGAHQEKVRAAGERLEKQGAGKLQTADFTAQTRQYAQTAYTTLLLDDWDSALRAQLVAAAAEVLGSIESGNFNYTLITAHRTAAPV